MLFRSRSAWLSWTAKPGSEELELGSNSTGQSSPRTPTGCSGGGRGRGCDAGDRRFGRDQASTWRGSARGQRDRGLAEWASGGLLCCLPSVRELHSLSSRSPLGRCYFGGSPVPFLLAASDLGHRALWPRRRNVSPMRRPWVGRRRWRQIGEVGISVDRGRLRRRASRPVDRASLGSAPSTCRRGRSCEGRSRPEQRRGGRREGGERADLRLNHPRIAVHWG